MKDIFSFIGKIGVLSLAFVCLSAPCTVYAQEDASGKVVIEETAPAKGAESAPGAAPVVQSSDAAPYTFTGGRRDPFVPFGGSIAPKPLPAEAKLVTDKDAADESVSVGKDAKTGEEITTLPVKVTGTVISGARNFAILAPAGEKGGGEKHSVSFMVTSGDKVGEYTVQSVTADKVVLVWKGKPFTIPVEKYSPVSKDGKASVIGGAPEKATLPVPEIKQEEKDEEAPAVDKKDESKGASKEPANNEKKVN